MNEETRRKAQLRGMCSKERVQEENGPWAFGVCPQLRLRAQSKRGWSGLVDASLVLRIFLFIRAHRQREEVSGIQLHALFV